MSNIQSKTEWHLFTIARCPTSFNDPFVVAIEAEDKDHAIKRLYDIYDDNYAAPNGGGKSEWHRVCERTDQLIRAKKYPIS